jgi:hypothetical protein
VTTALVGLASFVLGVMVGAVWAAAYDDRRDRRYDRDRKLADRERRTKRGNGWTS